MLKRIDTYYYSLVGLLIFSSISMMFVFFPIFLKSFQNYGLDEIGILLAASYLGTFVTPIVFLKIKYNITKIQISFLLFGVSNFLIVYEGMTFYSLIFVFFIYGLLRNIIQTYLEGQISKIFKEKYSIIRGIGSFGFLLTTLFIGMFYSNELIVYFSYILGFMFLFIGAFIGIKYKKVSFESEEYKLSIITSQKMYWLFIFVYHLGLGIYFSFLSIYLKDNSYSIMDISNAWNISVMAEIFMFFIFIYFKNKMSLLGFIRLSIFLTIIRFGLLNYFPENYSIVLLAQILHMFTFVVFHVNNIELMSKMFPNNFKMGLKTYFSIGYGLSLGLGSLLGGYIYSNEIMLNTAYIITLSLVVWFLFEIQHKKKKI